ncbi:hypothetical protein GCM10009802_41960 [Streptomyces synnematoformans]|uniref:Uncharacterized protein n=1 Tax=Streptomyces synnematoformans TaxID=415721 RepID=A0ABN2YY69_9ACTN
MSSRLSGPSGIPRAPGRVDFSLIGELRRTNFAPLRAMRKKTRTRAAAVAELRRKCLRDGVQRPVACPATSGNTPAAAAARRRVPAPPDTWGHPAGDPAKRRWPPPTRLGGDPDPPAEHVE